MAVKELKTKRKSDHSKMQVAAIEAHGLMRTHKLTAFQCVKRAVKIFQETELTQSTFSNLKTKVAKGSLKFAPDMLTAIKAEIAAIAAAKKEAAR